MPPTAALYGILATGSALVLSALYIIKPLRKLALFLLYALGCILLLVLLSKFGPAIGVNIGVNAKTCCVAGLLGLPGIALLLILNLFL